MFIAEKILNISRLHNLLNIIPIQPCYKAKCILNLPQSTILCNPAALFLFGAAVSLPENTPATALQIISTGCGFLCTLLQTS